MKKLIMLLCAGVLSLSLSACGNSSNTTTTTKETVTTTAATTTTATTTTTTTEATTTQAPTTTTTEATTTEAPTTTEAELSEYEKEKQELLGYIDEAYTGFTSAKAPMHFMVGNNGEFAVLVLENSNGHSYIDFVGSAVFDEASGVSTIIDSDRGYTFGFTAKQQSDGSFFLDCGNLGKAYLEMDEPENVIDTIFTVYETMDDGTDKFMEAIVTLNFIDSLDTAYTGLTAVEAPMFFLASSDGEFAALIMVSSNEKDYISFVGDFIVDDETGILMITDKDSGYTFGFTAEEIDDGTYYLDCGNLGECYLVEDEVKTVLEYIDAIYQELNDVTDAFMAEISR